MANSRKQTRDNRQRTTDNPRRPTSTIAAIATPPGSGGIGIVRISGPRAVDIAASVFRAAISDFVSHRLHYGHIVNPESGRVIDEVLLTVMPGPRSYTREDVVEIHAHSGPAALRAVLELVLKSGAELAAPGEFTKRAYLNGRIDLTQAEAVIDIIQARSEKSLEIATAQLGGRMGERIREIRNTLIRMLARIEAAIDFPEEVAEADADRMLGIIEREVVAEIKSLLRHHENARFLREGLKVVIAGRPNVGKSSLLNALLRKERAIVTAIPGTTRDAIEESLSIRGVPLILTDTAGLHGTDDPVEILGMEKTREHISRADMVLLVIDMARPLTQDDSDIHEAIRHRPFVIIANKCDLAEEGTAPDIPETWHEAPMVRTSAIYGDGLDRLEERVAEFFPEMNGNGSHAAVPNLRHKLALERALASASAAVEGVRDHMPFEVVDMDIRDSIDAMGEITGETMREDLLDEIFGNFCIGK